MKTLILTGLIGMAAISAAGCTVVAEHPHRHYIYAEPEGVVIVSPPPPPPAVIIVPGPRYGPPPHWRR